MLTQRGTELDMMIFVPTYNESGNVGQLYRRLVDAMEKVNLPFRLVFLDDSSPDGTGEILDQMSREDDRVMVVKRPGKSGIGSAHLWAIQYAVENHFKILVTLDADFSHSPEDLPRFVKTLQEDPQLGIVVGSRFLSEDSLSDWSLYRKFLTRLGHFLTRHLLRLPVDATGAFRAYRLEKIQLQVLKQVESKGYSFFFESLFFFIRQGKVKIQEISITLPRRTYGHSKMSMKDIGMSLFRLVELQIRLLRRPSA